MDIIINTDNHIKASQEFKDKYKDELKETLKRFENYVTRYEVYFSDENKGKSGPEDKKCVIEVRFKGREPESVTYFADTVAHSFNGAVEKIKSLLDRLVGQLHQSQKH